jgi:hypothetical protein
MSCPISYLDVVLLFVELEQQQCGPELAHLTFVLLRCGVAVPSSRMIEDLQTCMVYAFVMFMKMARTCVNGVKVTCDGFTHISLIKHKTGMTLFFVTNM